MNTKDHATKPPIFPLVSYDESNDDSIGARKLSEGEPLGDYGPPASPITPEPFPQKSPEEATEGARPEESPERATSGLPIWEHDKINRLRRANLHQIIYALTCGHHQQPVHSKHLY